MSSQGGPTSERGQALLASATALTQRGLRVFPVDAKKKPGIARYHGDRPYSMNVLRRFPWDEATFIGVAVQSDQVALDIDVKDGKRGVEHLAVLEARHGPLPLAVVRRTPSGGWHLLFGRGQRAQHVGFASRCVLPDGTYADIDIVHRRHRFLVAYDVPTWLEHPFPTVLLPPAWGATVTKSSRLIRTPHVDHHSSGSGRATAEELVVAVAGAKTNRNSTLNECLFRALIEGNPDPVLIDRFRQGGLDCGLDPDEVEATIASATRAVSTKWTFAVQWCQAVAGHPRMNGPRRWRTSKAVALVLAQHYMRRPGVGPVGMSVRQLGRETNMSIKSASKYLKDLRLAGLVVIQGGRQAADAREYRLVLPPEESPIGNTHPPSPYGGVLPIGDLFPTFPLHDLLTLRIGGHAAFVRMGGGPVFTQTCADVLVALLIGEGTRADLSRRTGRSWGAVDRAVLILVSAGIVDFDSVTRRVRLISDDVDAALDEWATAMGVIIRPERRAQLHRKESEAFRAYLEGTSLLRVAGPTDHH